MPTVIHRLAAWADAAPESIAQRYKEGANWKNITAREFRDSVHYLAVYLESKGFKKGDCSAIFSYNCPEWVQAELGALLAGGLSAGLYPNSAPKDVNYVINHTQAKVLFVQNADYYKKCPQLPCTELVISFEGDTSFSPKAISFKDAIQEGKKLSGSRKFADMLGALNKRDGAFLIYTSGTTGDPKGALLSHDNIAFTIDRVIETWKLELATHRLFSFLPLCHIAEKMQNLGLSLSCRYAVSYCSKFENLASELGEVEPTILLGVPRVWEKMKEGVEAKLLAAPPAKKKLATWAMAVGLRVGNARVLGQMPTVPDAIQYAIANKLVLSKIRKALGFGNLFLGGSGAAPFPKEVGFFFRALGIDVLEVFGQTESAGVISTSVYGVDCLGTVGRPILGVDFKIAEDGEVMCKGRTVFIGYYKNDQATAETIEDGWLHTGDLGALTPNGLLKIIGRKKEIMKTSGGKMIAPVPIEEQIKLDPHVSQVCLVGDNRKYLSALITLKEDYIKTAASNQGIKDGVIDYTEYNESIKKTLETVNKSRSSFERIKYFKILANDFSIERAEMTPTMKMKRNIIESNYASIINSMYEGNQEA